MRPIVENACAMQVIVRTFHCATRMPTSRAPRDQNHGLPPGMPCRMTHDRTVRIVTNRYFQAGLSGDVILSRLSYNAKRVLFLAGITRFFQNAMPAFRTVWLALRHTEFREWEEREMTSRIGNLSGRDRLLTPRQRQVLRLQAYGYTYQDISAQLGLSIWTVKNHHKQAVRGLGTALRLGPDERLRTSVACYILGLLDGGLTPREVARRIREIGPTRHDPQPEPALEESPFAAD